LVPRSEATSGSSSRETTDKVNTPNSVDTIEGIIMGNVNLEAVGVSGIGGTVTALLGFVPRDRVKGSGSQGKVVVHELSPRDEEDSGGMVMVSFIGMNGTGNDTWGWEGGALVTDSGIRDGVGVDGLQESSGGKVLRRRLVHKMKEAHICALAPD
jgi:hypothetical protein